MYVCPPYVVVFGALFALASKESFAQGLTLEVRLLLQLGYDLPARGLASKVLLLTSALSLLVIFIYFDSDLTATMTSKPPRLDVESFDDVVDQGYKIITYGKGLQEFYLKTAPEGSSMRWVYENQVLGNKEAIVMNFDELLNREASISFHDVMSP